MLHVAYVANYNVCGCYLSESYDASFLAWKTNGKFVMQNSRSSKKEMGTASFLQLKQTPRMDGVHVAFSLLGMGIKRQNRFVSHLIFPATIQTGSMAPSFWECGAWLVIQRLEQPSRQLSFNIPHPKDTIWFWVSILKSSLNINRRMFLMASLRLNSIFFSFCICTQR